MTLRGRTAALGLTAISLIALAACGQGGQQLAGNVAGRYATATVAGSATAGSELVKGGSPSGQLDDMSKTLAALDEPEKESPPPKRSYAGASGDSSGGGFNPSMCKSMAEGGTGFFSFYGSLATGRLGKLMDYCREIEDGGNDVADSSDGESGGGCVWKGRNYGPGESIYHTNGPIHSSDLYIHGQSFQSLSGRSGPWQQCQCSSSSGQWGCV